MIKIPAAVESGWGWGAGRGWERHLSSTPLARRQPPSPLVYLQNKVNHTAACGNAPLIADLKIGCGFDGWLMSEWVLGQGTECRCSLPRRARACDRGRCFP